jgi:hypothetical protein
LNPLDLRHKRAFYGDAVARAPRFGGWLQNQAFGDGSPGTVKSCERRTRSRWAV